LDFASICGNDGCTAASTYRPGKAYCKHPGGPALALRRETPQPDDTVFAIGAPLDLKFQSTVTRGVASANRIMDGFSFIQSDVTISPGNSGRPLLDDQGQVLGICDLSFRAGRDEPTGINYFVPIRDALDFLSAGQRERLSPTCELPPPPPAPMLTP
jgi:S1-C subfamily serine protease